jgi:ferredoxin-NADP reductase
METFPAKLIEKRGAARDTIAFVLEKPSKFSYEAGQYVSLVLPQLADKGPREAIRSMSLASAPSEDFLMIAMRLGPSPYKQVLWDMKPGETVEIRGPLGALVPHDTAKPSVYIAGGIGIAPFRGMLMDAQAKSWPHDITLLYSNRYRADAAFLDELQALENEHFKLVPILTREKNWSGERTHCDEAMIKRYVPDIQKPFYCIVGLPNMVTDVSMLLADMGIGFERIKTEFFTGY